MHTLKRFYLALMQLAKRSRLLPENVVRALDQRQQQVVQNDFESDRLDRLRNPSKYRGR